MTPDQTRAAARRSLLRTGQVITFTALLLTAVLTELAAATLTTRTPVGLLLTLAWLAAWNWCQVRLDREPTNR